MIIKYKCWIMIILCISFLSGCSSGKKYESGTSTTVDSTGISSKEISNVL